MNKSRDIFFIAAINIILAVSSLFIGKVFQGKVLGSPVLSWRENNVLYDSLPKGYDWVKQKSLEIKGDEFSVAYIANLCGDSQPEVIFRYGRDGIIFVNSQFVDIYSKDGNIKLLQEHNLNWLTFGLVKYRSSYVIYGFDFPIDTKCYYFTGAEFNKTELTIIATWAYKIGTYFLWSFIMPAEYGLLYLSIQVLMLLFLSRISFKNNLKSINLVSLVFISLFIVEGIVSSVGTFFPLFIFVGPIVGIILQVIAYLRLVAINEKLN